MMSEIEKIGFLLLVISVASRVSAGISAIDGRAGLNFDLNVTPNFGGNAGYESSGTNKAMGNENSLIGFNFYPQSGYDNMQLWGGIFTISIH